MANTGWKSASFNNESSTNATWTGKTNIYTDNGVTATVASSSNDANTTLELSGFSFGVPAGSVIDGIEVSVDGAITNYGGLIDMVGVKDGSSGSTSSVNLTNASTAETVVYGSPTDKWATSWTAANIDTLRIVMAHASLSAIGGNGFAAEYDAVLVKVYYSDAPVNDNTFFWSIV